jgi:hypothetical protein
MASAYLLKGVIASARASQARNNLRRADLDDHALIQFRTALQVHDYERDVQAKEYEAHQLRRLGHFAEAESAYEQLEDFAAWVQSERERSLVLARARKFRALIIQARVISEHSRGLRDGPGSAIANNLIASVKERRAPYTPFRGWEALEQGDVHLASAFVYFNLGFSNQELLQLNQAGTAYRSVLGQTPARWIMGSASKRLRAAAQAGLDRVANAQARQGYDASWLLPSSEHAQQPPSTIGNPGSQ